MYSVQGLGCLIACLLGVVLYHVARMRQRGFEDETLKAVEDMSSIALQNRLTTKKGYPF